MQQLILWMKAHPKRIFFIIGATIFFLTLLIFFFSNPSKERVVIQGNSYQQDLTQPPVIIDNGSNSNGYRPKADLSVMTSKLKDGKSDGIILFIFLLVLGAGFILYALLKKDKQ